jgi:hypothetical protein
MRTRGGVGVARVAHMWRSRGGQGGTHVAEETTEEPGRPAEHQ